MLVAAVYDAQPISLGGFSMCGASMPRSARAGVGIATPRASRPLPHELPDDHDTRGPLLTAGVCPDEIDAGRGRTSNVVPSVPT